MQSVIYEDNATCLRIANDMTPLTGPHTCHLLIEKHHFKIKSIPEASTLKKSLHLSIGPISSPNHSPLCNPIMHFASSCLVGDPVLFPHWWSQVWGSRGGLAWPLSPIVDPITWITRSVTLPSDWDWPMMSLLWCNLSLMVVSWMLSAMIQTLRNHPGFCSQP